MKKILCLILALIMLFTVCLTGCSGGVDNEDDNSDLSEEASDSTKTLTMYVITETKVCNTEAELKRFLEKECGGDVNSEKYKAAVATKASYDAVEAAINKLTKSNFKTQLNIYFYTEQEYYDKIEYMFEYNEKYFDEGVLESGDKDIEDETIINEDSGVELKYPDEMLNQLDILYVGSYDKYVEYADKGWLSELDSSMSGTLKSYIFPTFLDAVKYNSVTYGVPNNNIVGDYTYMLLNKEIVDDNFFNLSDFTSIYCDSVDQFLTLASTAYPEMTTIAGDMYSCLKSYAYLTVDPDTLEVYDDTFSVIGFDKLTADAPSLDEQGFYSFTNMFIGGRTHTNLLIKLKEYEYKGYYGEETEGKQFAMSVVKGDAGEIYEKYGEDYYPVVIGAPEADRGKMSSSMFAVSSYTTVALSRNMDIITYLNTDETVRNLFQYGIKGTNYTLNSDGCAVYAEGNLYKMDVNKTGNVLLAYPSHDCGMTATEWQEYFKKTNADSIRHPMYGFEEYLKQNADSIDRELIGLLNDYSATVKNLIDSYNPSNSTIDDFKTFINDLRNNAIEGIQMEVTKTGSTLVVYNRDLYKAGTSAYDPYMYCPAVKSNEVTLPIRDDLLSIRAIYEDYLASMGIQKQQ